MKPRIHLLYFEGCPNAEKARRNLASALSAAYLDSTGWEETDVQLPSSPEEWRGFPSPTILVNGRNIEDGSTRPAGAAGAADDPAPGSAGSCRLGGAPAIEIILKGLKLYGEAD
jgi:hypothetical protein